MCTEYKQQQWKKKRETNTINEKRCKHDGEDRKSTRATKVERGKKRFSNVKSGWHRFNYDAGVRESTTRAVTMHRIKFCCANQFKGVEI